MPKEQTSLIEVMADELVDSTESLENISNPAIAFILILGRALHNYGMAAHRLEAALSQCADHLGLKGQFFSTPTSFFAAFGDLEHQRTYLIRVEPGNINLEKLVQLDMVLDDVGGGELDLHAAIKHVREVVDAPRRYGPVMETLGFAVIAGGAANFFGGSYLEIALASVIGLLVGLLGIIVQRTPQSARLFETLAGLTASLAAFLGAWLFGPISIQTVTVSGIIVLLPGLMLTQAMNELATRNYVSGSARMFGSMMVLIALGFGVAVGFQIGRYFAIEEVAPSGGSLSGWGDFIALFISAWALTVLFNASPRDYLPILVASAIALFGTRGGGLLLGPQIGASMGAFFVGIASNLFARWKNRPATVTLLPGIILLVPGSIGFQSFSALMDQNVVTGVEAAFNVIMVGVSIVAGLLLANVAVPIRKEL